MATFKALILRSKFDTKKDGTTNVKIRITHKRKTNYLATDIFILPEQMDIITGQITGKNKNLITLKINNWLNRCIKTDLELGSRRDLLTIAQLKNYVMDGELENKTIDFFVFTEELIAHTKRKSTTLPFRSLVNSLKLFSGPILPFNSINLNYLLRFEKYLLGKGVKNGVVNYMASFRTIFNKARYLKNDEDIGVIPIPHYPFKRYKMPKRLLKSNEHVLTLSELQRLINYKPFGRGEEFAKDMFLLMFYLIGIESIDLFHLKKPINNRISYDRSKTGRPHSIKLEPEAKAIIDKYPSKTHLLNISGRYQNKESFLQSLNLYLHGSSPLNIFGLNKRIGIDKQITSKWAKHTWATIARNDCRINKADVALSLGHEDADNRVTDIYVKYNYSIIDDSNRKVLDCVSIFS